MGHRLALAETNRLSPHNEAAAKANAAFIAAAPRLVRELLAEVERLQAVAKAREAGCTDAVPTLADGETKNA